MGIPVVELWKHLQSPITMWLHAWDCWRVNAQIIVYTMAKYNLDQGQGIGEDYLSPVGSNAADLLGNRDLTRLVWTQEVCPAQPGVVGLE